MIKNITLVFLCFFLFSACRKEVTPEEWKKRLQGDWVGTTEKEVLMVKGDSIINGQPWLTRYFEYFRIEHEEIYIDSVKFQRAGTVKNYKYNLGYRIADWSEEQLQLIQVSRYDNTPNDTLELIKLKPIFENDFEQITISAGACHGNCPVFRLTIDALGKVNFQGINHTTLSGQWTGQLDNKALTRIKQKISYVQWDELESTYMDNVSGGQVIEVKILDKQGQRFITTTKSLETKALNMLIYEAFRIAEQADLGPLG